MTPNLHLRRVVAAGALICFGVLGRAAEATTQPSHPNIVIVLVEDQRWDDLGYAGHPFVQTPNLDRLARSGANFENAFVTTPHDVASRVGLLTGRHDAAVAFAGGGGGNALPREPATFVRLL